MIDIGGSSVKTMVSDREEMRKFPSGATLTPKEIALLLKARGKPVRIAGKGWRRLSVSLEEAPTAALEAAGFDPNALGEAALAGERHRLHALQLSQTSVMDLLPEKQAGVLRSRAHDLSRPVTPDIPAGMLAELRPKLVEEIAKKMNSEKKEKEKRKKK